uniref:Secreted protein n=1 Tax=Acrobeloides nanus TaxID=290746 RepID=A0A914CSW1_9BILA
MYIISNSFFLFLISGVVRKGYLNFYKIAKNSEIKVPSSAWTCDVCPARHIFEMCAVPAHVTEVACRDTSPLTSVF